MSAEIESLKSRLFARSKWNGECLESTFKARISLGYALVKFRKKPIGAHRASWIVHNGEIPEGYWVLHKCDNPLCINPDHLFLGKAKDNSCDMISKFRHDYWGNQKYSQEMANKAIEMRKQGMTYREISKRLELEINNINLFFRRSKTKEQVKEFYGVPKYSNEVREKAFELRKQGIPCKEIQKILNIPKRSLSRILNPVK